MMMHFLKKTLKRKESQMMMDLVVIRVAFQLAEYFFPDISLKWIYPEFEQALNSEVCLTEIFGTIIH